MDGARNCDLVTDELNDGDWVPLYKPNQYLAGLRVEVSFFFVTIQYYAYSICRVPVAVMKDSAGMNAPR